MCTLIKRYNFIKISSFVWLLEYLSTHGFSKLKGFSGEFCRTFSFTSATSALIDPDVCQSWSHPRFAPTFFLRKYCFIHGEAQDDRGHCCSWSIASLGCCELEIQCEITFYNKNHTRNPVYISKNVCKNSIIIDHSYFQFVYLFARTDRSNDDVSSCWMKLFWAPSSAYNG